MPIKVIKREPVSPSEPGGTYVMVAIGLAGDVQGTTGLPRVAEGGAGAGLGAQVATGNASLADVHLLWSTGEVEVSGLPAGVHVIEHTPAGLSRLTFRGVELKLQERADQPEWTSPGFGITASGLGHPTLLAVTTRRGGSLAEAVRADALSLDGAPATAPNWQRLIDTLPG